jgi:alginate O-acetyltransferase complex protein AlgJ
VDPAPSARFTRATAFVVSGLFLAAVCVPMLGTAVFPSSFDPYAENRLPAEFPALSIASLPDFPGGFERAFADRFAFRGALVHAANVASLSLGVSTSPKVVLGHGGWLFYSGENELDLYRRSSPFSRAELAAWKKSLEARRAWLAERGIRYLLVLPPNKESVYADEMPAEFEPLHRGSRLDQLVSMLKRHSDIPVVDVRRALKNARATEPVYAHTDTHWNDAGAFVAYGEVAGRLARWFPGLEPLERTQLIESHVWGPGGDLSALLALREELPERDVVLLRPSNPAAREVDPRVPLPEGAGPERIPHATEIDDPAKPKAVLLGDSFMNGLRPFLAEHFRRSLFLNTQEFPTDVIEREHPDVVIHEMLERLLNRPPPPGPP